MSRRIAFEPLIPASEGDRPACRASLVTRASRDGEAVELVVFDQGIALQAFRSGGWAREELERALDGVDLAHLRSDSMLIEPLVSRRLALTHDVLSLEDYAELENEILQNGLLLSETLPGVLRRPGIVVWSELDARELERALGAWAKRPGLPARSRALALSGARFFRDAERVRALTDAMAQGPLWLRQVELGGEADGRLLSRALHSLLAAWVRGPTEERFRVLVPADAYPALLRVRDRLDEIDPSVFERLTRAWHEDPVLRRRVDDGERGVLFAAISDARKASDADGESRAIVRSEERMGAASRWIRTFRRASRDGRARITIIPTWQCDLRCTYCTIPKQDGRVMSLSTVEQSLELLLSGDTDEVELHFFGGEPLTEWERVKHAFEYGTKRASEEGRKIRFLLTTAGFGLDPERLAFFARHTTRFQLSLDGDPATQDEYRPERNGGASYPGSPGGKAEMILASGIAHSVFMVVHPKNARRMAENFRHILSLGYRSVQMNHALGTRWDEASIRDFAAGLMEIGAELRRRRESGDPVELVNLRETLLPVRTNLEVTVDFDGTVFGTTAFLTISKHRDKFRLGHLDDACSLRRYVHEGFQREHLLSLWYRDGMAENNTAVGAVMNSFLRWMREQESA